MCFVLLKHFGILPGVQIVGLSLSFQVARYMQFIGEVLYVVVFSFWFLSKWSGVVYIVARENARSLALKDKTALKESGLLIFRGKKSKISRDFQGQIRGKIGRFRGIFAGKKSKFAEKSVHFAGF